MKQAFTPEGAANVLAHLYALPDDALQMEAQAFAHHLKDWLRTHFELNSHQEAYLAQLNEQATDFYAQLGGFAMRHRLPITLDVAPKESVESVKSVKSVKKGDKDDQGKIVYTKSTVTAVANGRGEILPEGELVYCIRYNLL